MTITGPARTLAVLEYHLVDYRRTWRSSAVSSFVLPLLTMLGFGVGVGAYVTGRRRRGAVPRLHRARPDRLHRAPGRGRRVDLAGAGQLRVASGSTSRRPPRRCGWPTSSAGTWPSSCFRVLASVAAFLLVAAVFGALHSVWALATLPLVVADRAGRGRARRSPTPPGYPHRQLPGDPVPVRGHPDVAVRRGVLPGRVAAGRAALGRRTRRRSGTASTCAGPPRSASRRSGRSPATCSTSAPGRSAAGCWPRPPSVAGSWSRKGIPWSASSCPG